MVAGLSALDEVLGSPSGYLVKNTGKFDEPTGEIATGCLKIINQGIPARDLQMGNTCAYVIEAAWCAAGADCNPSFSNMKTLQANGQPGSAYPIAFTSGEGRKRRVNYAACKGADTLEVDRAAPLAFFCNPPAGK